jgi:septal ring factor EnvC (AmiA/AmiB activator)
MREKVITSKTAQQAKGRLRRERCVALLCACLALGVQQMPLAQEPAPEEQLAQLNSAIADIETWLNSAANNRSALETQLRDNTQKIDGIRTQVAENRTAIASLQSQLVVLSQRSTALETDKAAQEALIKQAVRASYVSGQEPYLKLLLNQQDPAQSARMLHYYERFNRERLARVETFRETLNELLATRAQIEASSRERDAAEAQLQTQLDSLSAEQEQRSTLLTALKDDITTRSGELQQLTEDRGRLEALLVKIQEAIANIPPPEQLTPFAQARGKLPWPVAGTALNRFGAAYSDGNLHRAGVVMSAELGSPVRAVHPGRVVFADWLRGSGLLVVVDHGEGYLSLYAHNQSLVKRKGDWVNRGEALATSGENSGMGRPGIYFEIRHNGQAQDPAQWCES